MNEQDKIVNLALSIREINVILDSLGQKPYTEVYQLIGKIQQQVMEQIHEDGSDGRNDNDKISDEQT